MKFGANTDLHEINMHLQIGLEVALLSNLEHLSTLVWQKSHYKTSFLLCVT